jgi:hypothetical protein
LLETAAIPGFKLVRAQDPGERPSGQASTKTDWNRQALPGFDPDLTLCQQMASDRQGWLGDLSRQFKLHRQGRPGWFLRVKRDRLRLLSDELPPRPGEAIGGPTQRELTLATPPSPATAMPPWWC